MIPGHAPKPINDDPLRDAALALIRAIHEKDIEEVLDSFLALSEIAKVKEEGPEAPSFGEALMRRNGDWP